MRTRTCGTRWGDPWDHGDRPFLHSKIFHQIPPPGADISTIRHIVSAFHLGDMCAGRCLWSQVCARVTKRVHTELSSDRCEHTCGCPGSHHSKPKIERLTMPEWQLNTSSAQIAAATHLLLVYALCAGLQIERKYARPSGTAEAARLARCLAAWTPVNPWTPVIFEMGLLCW